MFPVVRWRIFDVVVVVILFNVRCYDDDDDNKKGLQHFPVRLFFKVLFAFVCAFAFVEPIIGQMILRKRERKRLVF